MSASVTHQTPVVVVVHDGPGGDIAAARVARFAPNLVLTGIGVERVLPEHPAVRARVPLPSGAVDVEHAFTVARDHDAFFVIVPRSLAGVEEMVPATLRAAAQIVDDSHPGLAIGIVNDQFPDLPYQRVLSIVDTQAAFGSDLKAWTAVAVAVRTGAPVDVLMLGVPEGTDLADGRWREHFPKSRQAGLLRRAVARAQQDGADVTFLAAGSGAAVPQAVLRRVLDGGYSLVLHGLGEVALPARIGRERAIERTLANSNEVLLPTLLLERGGCDVILVLDGVRLGLLPAKALTAAGVMALAAGMIGVGLPAGSAATDALAQGAPIVATDDPSDVAAVRVAAAQRATRSQATPRAALPATQPGKAPEKANQKAHQKGAQKPAPKSKGKGAKRAKSPGFTVEVPDEVTPTTLATVQTQADRKAQRAAKAEQRRKAAVAEREAANQRKERAAAKAERAQAASAEAARTLAQAREQKRLADEEVRQATADLEALERRASGLTGILPTSPSAAQQAEARRTLGNARAEAALAHAKEAAAYLKYQQFAEDIERTLAQMSAAEAEIARKQAKVAEARLQTKEAKREAQQARRLAQAYAKKYAEQGLVRPANGNITSPFGMRVHPVTGVYKLHTGVDFAYGNGAILSAGNGVVTYAGYDGAYGYMVKVDHGKVRGQRVETWYAHQPGLSVSVGQQVQAGQRIGTIGNTGYSTGPHLHFEVRVNGQPVDPMAWIR
jgi:murein DD-endopeptidase MepM/ murein hydrolase activator NlpD